MGFLERIKIQQSNPDIASAHHKKGLDQARQAMLDTGCWSTHQQMGRRWPIGCVALEITQRCNLDCTLCYLSEHSEMVKDIPLNEIFKRIDQIYEQYGINTDIQVTGGDPTLRQHDELISIIQYIHAKKMRSTLMTNGIRATRPLLKKLATAGLNDIAFHVDTTQDRKGYTSEISLNAIREEYINRTKGLGLSVMFNTTIHKNNFHDIQRLVEFFIQHSRFIRTVSFQLQADTGRGIERKRADLISPDSVWQNIEQAAGTRINNEAIKTGHPACNRYGMGLVINNKYFDLFDDTQFIGKMHALTAHITADRQNPWMTMNQFLQWLYRHPGYSVDFFRWMLKKINLMAKDLIIARGRINTLSFFIHNFMDACDLDAERIHACVFKTLGNDGFVSMCLYNAHRDENILKPVTFNDKNNKKFWDPLTGKLKNMDRSNNSPRINEIPAKYLKGRYRKKRANNSIKITG